MAHQLNRILALAAVGAIAAGLAYGGGLDGPMRGEHVIPGKGTHYQTVRFQGGEDAIVIVSGDGDSDLDLFIHDGNNNIVCSDDDTSDLAMCRWTPNYSASYRLRIKNIGPTANRYWLRTN